MQIFTEQEIANMITVINPQLDKSNIIQFEDQHLTKIVDHYLFLQQCGEEIISLFQATREDVLYSQYYWFVYFKNQYFTRVGYDGGIEQQAFLLMEHIANELADDVDWTMIEEIDNRIYE